MIKSERIQCLADLNPTQEKKLIYYDNAKTLFDVYEVPMKYLVYNQYNGRIKAMSKSWEKANHKLNSENNKDVSIIEQFLWDSAPSKNEQTLHSIRQYGQFEVGMITQDGVIIDGNRRASIINIINREEQDSTKHLKFRAIILPTESYESGQEVEKEKEIIKLETIYQMGVDSKVDYNPIEKYLRCNELFEFGYSISEIANMLSIEHSAINKMKEIFELMKKYLSRYDYNGIFIGLEKREGHFVDLRGYLASYDRGVGRSYAKWDFTTDDLNNLENAYFDYARMKYPVHNCRLIANPSKSQSFFCHEDIWSEFYNDHSGIVSSIQEEELDILSERVKERKIHSILADRDELWTKTIKDDLIDNLYTNKRRLEDRIKLNVPHKKLISARNTIDSIKNEEIEGKNDVEIDRVSDEISTSIDRIKEANQL